jgi:hypothetical protein
MIAERHDAPATKRCGGGGYFEITLLPATAHDLE